MQLGTIVIDAQAGSEVAFARLVEATLPSLFRFVRRFAHDDGEAEDLCQEAYVRVHKALDRFESDRPFRPWLYRIAKNLAISSARKRKRRPAEHLATDPMCDRPGAHTQLATRERNERVREAIDRLPPKYRAIVCLYYLDEMPVAEIAEAMEMPVGTVKIRLHRARALLKERLQDTLGQGGEAALRLETHEGSGGAKAMRAARS